MHRYITDDVAVRDGTPVSPRDGDRMVCGEEPGPGSGRAGESETRGRTASLENPGERPQPEADAITPEQLWTARTVWQEAPAMSDRVLRQWWGNVRMRWNCHSTAIEGSRLSYRDTLDVLVHEQAPAGRPPLLDIDQIRGHNAAAQQLAHWINQGHVVQLADLHDLHRTLLVRPYPARNLRGDPTGRMVRLGLFKASPNALVSHGTIVEFAPPEQVPYLMQAWWERMTQRMDIMRQDPEALDPAWVLASTHWDFIAIHPYDDGNGRLARWITNYMSMVMGYPPLVITLAQQEAYFACFHGRTQREIPGTPEECRPLRDFLAACVQNSVAFGCAVARGETDPSWHNAQAALNRPVPEGAPYPAETLVPYLRPQDRRAGPDGTAL